jgi:hypothetical protein
MSSVTLKVATRSQHHSPCINTKLKLAHVWQIHYHGNYECTIKKSYRHTRDNKITTTIFHIQRTRECSQN